MAKEYIRPYFTHQPSAHGNGWPSNKLSEDTAPWHRALQGLENGQTGPDLGLAEGGGLEYINIYIRRVMPT